MVAPPRKPDLIHAKLDDNLNPRIPSVHMGWRMVMGERDKPHAVERLRAHSFTLVRAPTRYNCFQAHRAASAAGRRRLVSSTGDGNRSKLREADDLPAGLDGVYLSGLPRDAEAEADVDADGDSDGGDVCFRQHDQ